MNSINKFKKPINISSVVITVVASVSIREAVTTAVTDGNRKEAKAN